MVLCVSLLNQGRIPANTKHVCFKNSRFLILDMHVKNNKYGNFVSISRSTGKCEARKLKTFAVPVYGHGLRSSQNKITDFLMILA